ncbi:hypothetical protein J1C56_28375 [Aminobacter anthyllidis]|uniref:Uncharacterized protein n=1 Tax=Aminobacter anthyllidis TaxID=1035067 RepID=A0A9X1AGV0_9HYPH|nr:hypothetical protein [Aminobacter anthyllidis]MBT1159488.1 hypothetical protein [Aminobacter anthyllidis]
MMIASRTPEPVMATDAPGQCEGAPALYLQASRAAIFRSHLRSSTAAGESVQLSFHVSIPLAQATEVGDPDELALFYQRPHQPVPARGNALIA